MKLKKILAGVLASAMTLTAGFIPEIVNETAPIIQSAITASAASYSNIGEFFETAEDVKNCEFLDGTNDENYMIIKGRKYYQGIKMLTRGNLGAAAVTFNVENISKISFDFGRIDNTYYNGLVLAVTKNGESWKEYAIEAHDPWQEISLDVSKASTIGLSLYQEYGGEYGLGDFTIDDLPVAMPHVSPYYKTAEDFMNSGDFNNCKFYGNDDEEDDDEDETNKYMRFKGRTYYQGIKMSTRGNLGAAYINYNVENAKTLSFDFCRIDNTNHNGIVLLITKDGENWKEIEVTYYDCWNKIELDVSKASTIGLSLYQEYGAEYGIGDITIDGLPVAEPHEAPVYSNIKDFLDHSDSKNVEFYYGNDEENYMTLKGRKYYQGIKMSTWSGIGESTITFNVENVKNISFTVCRESNAGYMDDVTFAVYRNGKWWQDFDVKASENWKDMSFDVSKLDTLGITVYDSGGTAYGLADIIVDDIPLEMLYDTPKYDSELDFMNSSFDSNFIIFDGSNTFKNLAMGGKEYCQGIQFDGGNKNAQFNVENVDSMTFTLGRVDGTAERDICLDIYKEGELWYQLVQPAKQAPTQYKLNLKDTSIVKIVNNSDTNCGLMNFAVNDNYSSFTDGTYDFTEEVYTDPSKITAICVHNYEGNKCTLCGLVCEHKFEKGICTVCGFKCTHEYKDGVCKACGHECTHSFEDGVCTFCALKCRHVYEDGRCKVCGVVCEHEGYKCGFCEDCGIECAHEYENGKCTVCRMNIRGDISDNSTIDLYDAIEIAKYLVGKRIFTEEERITADYNKDGKVDLYDAIAIAKYIIGK